MPGGDEIHSLLGEEQQWLTESLRAKNKSGLSPRRCVAHAPLIVSLGSMWFAQFSDEPQETFSTHADSFAGGVQC